jgi:hypothetical protein
MGAEMGSWANDSPITMLTDTHPDAEKVQIELLRRATPEQRLRMALNLTATVVNLSRRTIAELNPDLSPEEVNLKWVEFCYGKELAARLRSYLQKNAGSLAKARKGTEAN